jgi:hypothetical protein
VVNLALKPNGWAKTEETIHLHFYYSTIIPEKAKPKIETRRGLTRIGQTNPPVSGHRRRLGVERLGVDRQFKKGSSRETAISGTCGRKGSSLTHHYNFSILR